jgi:hypothetical protein
LHPQACEASLRIVVSKCSSISATKVIVITDVLMTAIGFTDSLATVMFREIPVETGNSANVISLP